MPPGRGARAGSGSGSFNSSRAARALFLLRRERRPVAAAPLPKHQVQRAAPGLAERVARRGLPTQRRERRRPLYRDAHEGPAARPRPPAEGPAAGVEGRLRRFQQAPRVAL